MTVAPSSDVSSDAILTSMGEPVRVNNAGYETYQFGDYTIQHSDRPGYTDRWFVYKERPPYMVYLRNPDGSLNTFRSVDEAAAWLGDNPYLLPDP
jgi:hypothetical protein